MSFILFVWLITAKQLRKEKLMSTMMNRLFVKMMVTCHYDTTKRSKFSLLLFIWMLGINVVHSSTINRVNGYDSTNNNNNDILILLPLLPLKIKMNTDNIRSQELTTSISVQATNDVTFCWNDDLYVRGIGTEPDSCVYE
jgi:hypothetical protein